MISDVVFMDPRLLKDHPENSKIYLHNEDDMLEMIESIREHDIIQPIVATRNNIILSGHRRKKAAIRLNKEIVPVTFVDLEKEEPVIHGIELLIEYNHYRIKSNIEKLREVEMKKKTISARKALGEDTNKELKEKGYDKTRDMLGDSVGMSGKTVDKGLKVVKAIDDAETPEEKHKIEEALNKSVDAGYKVATEEEIEEIPADFKKKKAKLPSIKDSVVDLTAGDYFYSRDLSDLCKKMNSVYDRLRRQRTKDTPKALGSMIGNIKEMEERLKTWIPDNMVDCPNCDGEMELDHQDEIRGDVVKVACDNCLRGKVGHYKESKY